MMFTQAQIANWRIYEEIRQGGRYNMYDPRAREMTDMSVSEWCLNMDKYAELKEAAEAKPTSAKI
jgi:hypothetical protein